MKNIYYKLIINTAQLFCNIKLRNEKNDERIMSLQDIITFVTNQ
jgi:hypothetical protein